MPRRKKVEVSPVLEELEKEVEKELEVENEQKEKETEHSTHIYGCFPVGYVMPEDEEVE